MQWKRSAAGALLAPLKVKLLWGFCYENTYFCFTYRGNVAFPKGHLEEGESEEQAAAREMVEETGLQNPRMVRKLGIVSRLSKEDSGETVFKDIHLFLMQINSFIHGKAEEQYGWFSYEEALEKLSFQEEKDFLKKIWPEIVK